MEIFIWILSVVSIALALGELYYRYLKRKKDERNLQFNRVSSSVKDSMDISMDELTAEYAEMIPRVKLQMRGSWRLAKDKYLPMRSFAKISDNEYRKML